MNRHKSLLSLLALLSLFVIHSLTYAAPAFTEQFNRDLSLTPFTWSSESNTASGTSNVADAQASDGRALKLSIAAGQAPYPGAGSNLQSTQLYSYGTYETRLKTAACASNEGVINGFFTFQNGGDTNGNGVPDNSEIDFEWLCAQPEVIFLTLWTDYNGATDESRRVFREINLATGKINYTRYSTNFGGVYTDLSNSPTENQPTTVQAIPGYNSSTAYYEYGFTWTETSVTWWVVNPANGQKIILWDYRGPSERITKVPAAYMANLWHHPNWTPATCCTDAKQPPAATRTLSVDWMRYSPPGTTPPTATPTNPPTATPITPTPQPSANLALNRPATSSSIEAAGLEASKAFDGVAGTRWASAYSDPQWIQVDLGAPYNLNRAVLKWEAAYGRAYRIETSTDGASWTQRYSTTTGDGGTDDLAISGSARYVRLTGTARATQWGYSLWEFEVYGSGTVSPTPTTPPPPTATPPPSSNITLANPGFEASGATQAPTGWSTWGPNASDYNADFTESFGGSHGGSYHLTQYAEAPYEVFTYQTKTGLVNGTYTLRAWVRSTGGQTAVEMQAKEFNGTATILRQAVPANDSWNQITISNIQVTNGQLVLGFYSKAPAYKYLYVDDVTLVKN